MERTCKHHGLVKWVYVPSDGHKLCTGCLNDGSYGEALLREAAEMYMDLALRSHPVGDNDSPVALAHGYLVYEFSLTGALRIAKLGSKEYEAGQWYTVTDATAGALAASEARPVSADGDPERLSDFSKLEPAPRRNIWKMLTDALRGRS